jgi:hypothetical protein
MELENIILSEQDRHRKSQLFMEVKQSTQVSSEWNGGYQRLGGWVRGQMMVMSAKPPLNRGVHFFL